MNSTKNVANVVGGKTARACDSCIKKRARWYCAADDAFLCQSCDAAVHSANSLARRHERVRLKTASSSSLKLTTIASSSPPDNLTTTPSWHQGFTRKARTPRHGHNNNNHKQQQHQHHDLDLDYNNILVPDDLVPEGCNSDELYSSEYQEEEQLLYRVPIFDPFISELCVSTTASTGVINHDDARNDGKSFGNKESSNGDLNLVSGYGDVECNDLHGFLPSDMELAEFAADVESLLGRGLEDGSFGMEELGFMNSCKDEQETNTKPYSNNKVDMDCSLSSSQLPVKIEEEEEGIITINESNIEDNINVNLWKDGFKLTFDFDSPIICGEENHHDHNHNEDHDQDNHNPDQDRDHDYENKIIKMDKDDDDENDDSAKNTKKRRMILLNLDYDKVIAEWATQGSPWTTGERPDFNINDSWPHQYLTGFNNGREVQHGYGGGECVGIAGNAPLGDGGREARVSRYREKRRTRLFTKKIRYEVRKLNAEKRPRMKGRFVKRTSYFPCDLVSK